LKSGRGRRLKIRSIHWFLILLNNNNNNNNYLQQLCFNSAAIVLTVVQAKEIRKNKHKLNNKIHRTNNTKQVNTSTHITKTPTQLL
jgi:hypothetical protein